MEVTGRSSRVAWLGAGIGFACFGLGALTIQGNVYVLGMAFVGALGLAAQAVQRVVQHSTRPLVTAANVLDALRHGDYMHRARIDGGGEPVRALLCEVNELAEHLEAERLRTKETSALLESLIEKVDVALLAFDEQEQLVWWNPAATKLFRAKLRQGATAQSLDAQPLLTGATERSVLVGGQASTAAWELRRGVFLRESKRYQFLLLASAQRVRREEERAAWQRLVRVLGHEVNNTLAPIQSLAGTCQNMLAGGNARDLPQVVKALSAIEHRAGSLGAFISEFARLARMPEPKSSPIDLAERIRRIAALDTRCRVEVETQGHLEILGDSSLLEQALSNLIRNAVDATAPEEGRVIISWSTEGDQALIQIVDEGDGIGNSDNLFVPLFSTKPGGSGIGLVLSRNIVEAHGGQLRLENRADQQGCVARMSLPLAGPPTGDSRPG